MKRSVIIPAAGKGLRTGENAPKQYLEADGKEIIVYTLELFQNSDSVDEIVIAAGKDYHPHLEELKQRFGLDKISKTVEGGKERQDSVYNALSSLSSTSGDLVAVHDAARPLITQKIIENAFDLAADKGNAVVSVQARDTLAETTAGYTPLDRSTIRIIQTPQIFEYSLLKQAFKKAQQDDFHGTDESMLVSRLGTEIFFAEGSSLNIKITYKEDIEFFRAAAVNKLT